MSTKLRDKIEYGDFQTPDQLVLAVCQIVKGLGVPPKAVIEPTCGKGSFLRRVPQFFPSAIEVLGFDVNPRHAQMADAIEGVNAYCEDFFGKDWTHTFNRQEEPILVIGNPPWVTNATVGAMSGSNLPVKSNVGGFGGLDAITGKSNFDISEWMLRHLLQCLSGRKAVLAMLCKTTVARKVLSYAWNDRLQVSSSSIYPIDAGRHFQASVDACLLIVVLEPGAMSNECTIFPELGSRLTRVVDLDVAQWAFGGRF